MKILVYLILGLFCLSLVSAIINNPNLPQITRKPQTSSSASNNNTLNVNNSNCWKSDCGGFRAQVNQNVNTTSSPTFGGLSVGGINAGQIIMTATDTAFYILNNGFEDIFQITTNTEDNGPLFQGLNNLDYSLSNDDQSVQDTFRDNGIRYFRTVFGYEYRTANDVMTLNVTNTTSRLNSNLTVVGSIGIGTTNPVNKLDVVGRINATTVIANASNATRPAYSFTGDEDTGWYSNGAGNMAYTSNGFLRFWFSSDGQFNFGSLTPSISNSTKTIFPIAHNHNGTGIYRGYNETSGYVIPHQVYNYNGSVALNTQYNNTLDRPIMVSVTGVSTVSLLNDIAYFTMKNGAAVPDEPQAYGCIKQITGSVGVAVYCQLTMTVPSGYVWTVNSTIGGSGTTTIELAKVTVL